MFTIEPEKTKVSSFLERVSLGDFSYNIGFDFVVLTRTHSGVYESDGDLWKYHQVEKYHLNINDFSQIIDILQRDGKYELNYDGVYTYFFQKHDVLSGDIFDTTNRKETGQIKGYLSLERDKNLLRVDGIRFQK